MKITNLPRPWLLAAMTGVPMSTLLEQAERERPGAEEARHEVLQAYWRGPFQRADQPPAHGPARRVEARRLAS